MSDTKTLPLAFGRELLADATVDPLAQQIDVTHVPRVFLDHSDQHLAQRHRAAPAAVLVQRIVSGDVEARCVGNETLGRVRSAQPPSRTEVV